MCDRLLKRGQVRSGGTEKVLQNCSLLRASKGREGLHWVRAGGYFYAVNRKSEIAYNAKLFTANRLAIAKEFDLMSQ